MPNFLPMTPVLWGNHLLDNLWDTLFCLDAMELEVDFSKSGLIEGDMVDGATSFGLVIYVLNNCLNIDKCWWEREGSLREVWNDS